MSATFPLEAVVSVATKDAEDSFGKLGDALISALDGISEELGDIGRYLDEIQANTFASADASEASSQKQTNSWSRVGKAIGGVTLLAGGFLKSMVDASPALAGSLDEIGFQFERMFNVLGDSLVPTIDALLPMVEYLVEIFLSLDTGTQTVIAQFVVATVVTGALSTAMGILGISIGAVAWPILAIIAALALLYLAWENDFGGIQGITAETFASVNELFSNFWDNNSESISKLGESFKELWVIIGPIIELIATMFWTYLGGEIESVVNFIMEVFESLITFTQGLVDVIIGLFTGDWERVGEGIKDMFTGIVNALVAVLNLIVVDPINSMVNMLNEIPGIDIEWRMPSIPKLHDGGVVGGNLGTDEVLRVLERGEGVIDKDTMRKGIGGGGHTINVNFYNTQVRNNRDIESIRSGAQDGAAAGIKNISRFVNGGYSP